MASDGDGREASSGVDLGDVLERLENLLPGRLAQGEAIRRQHANALTFHAAEPPDAVVWPHTTEEVSQIVKIAASRRVPLVAFGGGTSLEGHINCPSGGISIDFSKMTRVIAVRPDDLDCTVEAGVSRRRLNQELRDTGLFFPVDPGSEEATLGGMAATRASGTTTVRYGSMRENVINLTAVLASGAIVRTARRARKSSAGYDLTRLLVGSEGTLGLITEVTLKLYGVPESILAAVATFDSLEGACRTATAAIQSGLALARIELLDTAQIAAVNQYSKLSLAETPTLFLEFHGSSLSCLKDLETFGELGEGEGMSALKSASDEDGRRTLWRARHDALWAVKTLWAGREVLVTDVAVPLSHLATAVRETAEDVAHSGLIATIVGHVGDGNFHAILAFDSSSAGERARVEAFLDRLVARALTFDGTATGEHGIGQGKRRFMVREHGEAIVAMQAIKTALDPLNILNPGKIL
ncbi:MAG: FAD-linked oxidase C-terminal domain-containing protein [Hyphomicrobium sp.]